MVDSALNHPETEKSPVESASPSSVQDHCGSDFEVRLILSDCFRYKLYTYHNRHKKIFCQLLVPIMKIMEMQYSKVLLHFIKSAGLYLWCRAGTRD